MNCQIGPKLVGCRVVIETLTGKIEGDVRHVDPSGCKLSLVNGKVVETGIQLPSLYRLFVRDILSISPAAGSVVSSETSSPSGAVLKSPRNGGQKIQTSSYSDKILQQESPTTKKNQPLVIQKNLPYHIKLLNNCVKPDILTNQVPFTENGKEVNPIISIPNYTIIEQIDDLFSCAIDRIEKESVIGFSMEGVRIGRFGVICWIGIATSDHAFLFDMCSLGPAGVKIGLGNIITSSKILKVIHNCRFIADALLHQYGTMLDNVFDTQVGASVVELKKNGQFNRFVASLPRALSNFLNMPNNAMFHPRVREGHEKEDESIWKQRPLPQHLVEGAVFNVCYLKKLRLAIMENLLAEVIEGTTLFLKDISTLPDDSISEKGVTAHLMPLSFKELASPAKSPDGEIFRSVVPMNGCDPYISFTRNISQVRRN